MTNKVHLNQTNNLFKYCNTFRPIGHLQGHHVIQYNNNNHGSTALYGLGPPLSEVTWSAHMWQFGDQPTGRAVQLNPDVTARAIWQEVRRLG
jgi:hypothetical protein